MGWSPGQVSPVALGVAGGPGRPTRCPGLWDRGGSGLGLPGVGSEKSGRGVRAQVRAGWEGVWLQRGSSGGLFRMTVLSCTPILVVLP